MNAVGEYLLVKADAWTRTRIVFPVQETLQLQLARHTRQREHCSGDALKQKLVNLVAQALLFYKNTREVFVVGTCVDGRLVLVCTSSDPGVAEHVHELGGSDDDTNAATYLQDVLHMCLSNMETFTPQVFGCFTSESLTGVPCWELPPPSGTGMLVQPLATLAVYARPAAAVQHALPLLDSTGCVFAFEGVQLSALFSNLYVKLYDGVVLTGAWPVELTASAMADLQRVLAGLVQSHNAWVCNFVSAPLDFMDSMLPVSSSFAAALAPTVTTETVHASADVSVLAPLLLPALVSYASTPNFEEWQHQFDTSPLRLTDMRQQRHRQLVRAYIEVKEEEMRETSKTGVQILEQKQGMLLALANETTALPHMDGIVFDLLLLDVPLANVPPLYHPAHFLSDARCDGFTTVHLLMYWRQTLARFISVGMETLDTEQLKQAVSQYRNFRVGLIVQPPQTALVKSAQREVHGQPCFFINISEAAMRCRPTLQQQKAESRNFFVGYFITHALVQLVPLLCRQGEDACVVCASLFGAYHGQMKPNSLNNLTKLYEKLQGTARVIRQKAGRQLEPAVSRRR